MMKDLRAVKKIVGDLSRYLAMRGCKLNDMTEDPNYINEDIGYQLLTDKKKISMIIVGDSEESPIYFDIEDSYFKKKDTHSIIADTKAGVLLYYQEKINKVFIIHQMKDFKEMYKRKKSEIDKITGGNSFLAFSDFEDIVLQCGDILDMEKQDLRAISLSICKAKIFSNIANYATDAHKGKSGEDEFKLYLKRILDRYGYKLIDVTGLKEYHETDIDFLMEIKNRKIAVELKTDYYENPRNLFYEDISSLEKNSLGCFNKTKANVLIYFFKHSKDIYIFYNMNKFKDYYEENYSKFSRKEVTNNRYDGSRYTCVGRTIPLKIIERDMREQKFGLKMNLEHSEDRQILAAILKTDSYELGEDILTSSRVAIRPIFSAIKSASV